MVDERMPFLPGMQCMLTLTEIEHAVDRLTADEKRELRRYLQDALDKSSGTAPGTGSQRQRVQLPLVPSANPGSRALTAERVAEILSDEDADLVMLAQDGCRSDV